MRTLALIPARAGSKGIPGKNTRDFNGKPLLSWAIRVGRATCDYAVVTTDDDEAAGMAQYFGAQVWRRGSYLAADDTPMLAVLQNALPAWSEDVIVLLQPTQPLRKPEHVREALRLLEETGADSVVSVVQIPAHYSPDYAVDIEHGRLLPWGHQYMPFGMNMSGEGKYRRQDCRLAYSRDGTVYAIRRQTIEAGSLYGSHCVPLIIPSNESVNLDTEEDWTRAEAMVNR